MANILTAIQTIVQNYNVQLSISGLQSNQMNAMGVALEEFVKDIFANAIELSEPQKLQAHANVFSYLGNQNNPPDMILKGGDAIEVKKIERLTNTIALNSSYPKEKLYSNNPMITDACRHCEDWQEKDIIYAIGTVENKTHLKHLWFIYGDCFIADAAIYERIKDRIATGIQSIPNVSFTQTKELGKVKKVDPLGITDLRIRGMWSIENPTKIFTSIHPIDSAARFQLSCLMKADKFASFSLSEQNAILSMQSANFTISDVSIKNPNNPALIISAKLFCFKV